MNGSKKEKSQIRIPKPFLLLAGISGTGKTRFIRKQAERAIDAYNEKAEVKMEERSNYCLVPVRPDWHEPSDLLGYITRISGTRYVPTNFLKFLVSAWMHTADTNALTPDNEVIPLKPLETICPFWLCLDEMNLAPVEQYFADYLSVLETRKWEGKCYSSDALFSPGVFDALRSAASEDDSPLEALKEDLFGSTPEDEAEAVRQDTLWTWFVNHGIPLPPNLIVAGTVNMDETTHGFSRKVIDRALTLDFQEFFPNKFSTFSGTQKMPKLFGFPIHTQMHKEKEGNEYVMEKGSKADEDWTRSISFLSSINTILQNTPFELAYRALNELLLSIAAFNPQDEKNLQAVWDDFLMQKVLPRIGGDAQKLKYTGEVKASGTESEDKVSPKTLPDGEYGSGTILHELYRVCSAQLGEIWPQKDDQKNDIEGTGLRPDLLIAHGGNVHCRTEKKLRWMMRRLKQTHFTDFWV